MSVFETYYGNRAVGPILAGLSVVALIAAGWFSVRLALADHEFGKGTPEGIARAAALLPRDTAYLSLDVLQTEYDGGDPRPALERIIDLTPLASAPRIRLGLDDEARGDFAGAEKWLLDAARVDRQFEPAWTLANFYFRQQRTEDFWQWMRTALDTSYGDRTPAFELCWRASQDAAEILRRAIPDRREVVAAYVGYLLQQDKPADAAAPAIRLAGWHAADDAPLLDQTSDALIDAGRESLAAEVWTASGQAAPEALSDSGFEGAGTNHGFAWRLIQSPGVTHAPLDSPQAHRIELNGQQPESIDLLHRYVRVTPHEKLSLSWDARTMGFPAATGLSWRVGNFNGALAASDDWKSGELTFTSPAEWIMLTLHYQRPLGETRAEGWVEIRNLRIEAARP